jgi:1-acyl-sn-glycerol-3-phosphate acyltransferase
MTILFLFCLLFVWIRYDLGLKLHLLFHDPRTSEYLERTQKKTSRLIFSLVQTFTGFKIEVEPFRGRLPSPVIVVTNHQSLADIPVLIYALPRLSIRFVTKRELGRGIPMVSSYLRAGGSALISRKGNFSRVIRELGKLAGLSASGISPVVFPEGTRSRSGRLGSFHAGAFRTLCARSSLPVLVVAMDGGWRISRLSGVFTKLNLTRYRVKPVAMYPHPEGKKEIGDLLEKAHRDIDGQLDAWRSTADPSGPSADMSEGAGSPIGQKTKKTHPREDGSER